MDKNKMSRFIGPPCRSTRLKLPFRHKSADFWWWRYGPRRQRVKARSERRNWTGLNSPIG